MFSYFSNPYSISTDLDLSRYPNTPHFYYTYPLQMIELMLIVPNEYRSIGSAYTNSAGYTYLIDLLMLTNAVVRKIIALIVNPQHARSILYYFFDTYRLMHGISSSLPLRNAAEYVFRLTLSQFSIVYSTTLCMLYIQYVYDINRQQFGSIADVVRAELPVYCNDNMAKQSPFEIACLLRPGGQPMRNVNVTTGLQWLATAPRVALLTSTERVRWLQQEIWADVAQMDWPYRVLPRKAGQVYRTYAVSLFDPMGGRYERLLQRAGEHGFLEHFAERNRQVG